MLVGSPEQVIDKFGRYQEAFGHELSGVSLEVAGLPEDENRASIETFVTRSSLYSGYLPEPRLAFCLGHTCLEGCRWVP